MEGVLYKWTNYLSGECRPPCVRGALGRLAARTESGVPGEAGSPGPLAGSTPISRIGRGAASLGPQPSCWVLGASHPWIPESPRRLSLGTFRVIPLQTD